MSGGSWDYIYGKFSEVGRRLSADSCPYRRALAAKVLEVSDAMYAIEWVDSGDNAEGSDILAIKKALGTGCNEAVLDVLVKDARDMVLRLNKAIKEAQK